MDFEITRPTHRFFKCSRCSLTFKKKLYESSSGIARCALCEYPCVEYRFKHLACGVLLTDEQAVRRLPIYSQMKYFWLKHPKAWEENIKSRAIMKNKEGGNKDRVYLNDSRGRRLGLMPEAVSL
jgi:hypothetical protein